MSTTTPQPPSESFPDLIRRLFEQFAQLINQEKELLKAEGKATLQKAVQIAILGVLAVQFVGLVLLFAGVSLIAFLMQAGMAFLPAALSTTGVMLVVTLSLVMAGYVRLKRGYPELLGDKPVHVIE